MVNNPNIRFAGFSDDWVQRKLGDFLSIPEKIRADVNESSDLMTLKLNLGGIGIGANRETLELGATIYYERKAGQFIYGKQNFFNGSMAIIPPELDGKATSGDVPSLDISGINPNYLYTYVSRRDYWKKKEAAASGTGSKRIHEATLFGFDISEPGLKEQQKIGSIFSTLDHKIGLEERQISLLKDLKKGYLQKMFPKQGATEPEIRFKGFTDAWELRKFKDLLDKTDGVRRGPFGSALKKEYFVPKSNFVVYEQQNAIYDNYETRYKITEEKYNELIKFKVEPGAFIMSGAGTIGRISRVPNDIEPGVFNQALIRFKINNELTDSEYFIQFVRADFMQRKLTGTNAGSAMTNLVPMSEVKKWIIQVPTLSEQQKIGSFFQKLDDTIRHHQRELDLLKDLKKGLSQQMFV